jgi:hypothetical protein
VWLVIECGFLPGRPSRWAAENPAPVVPEIDDEPLPSSPPRTIGTVQRREHRAWDARLLMKIAGNAAGLVIAAVVVYMWLHAMPDNLQATFEMPGSTKTAE